MKIFYAASTRGFYREGAALPDDSVEVSKDRFEEIFKLQEQGFIIVPGDDGHPAVTENTSFMQM